MKNIALIGFMGSGKSTVAAILAKKMNCELREIDEDIVHSSGYKSVNQLFENKGEEHFRELEKEAIKEAVKKTGQVISCGGGTVSSAEAMKFLKQNSTVIFLQADFKTISHRLAKTNSRPLFTDIEKAQSLYTERQPLYKKYTDIEIKTDNKTAEEVVEAIIAHLTKNENTKLSYVIGDPVAHSLSPTMHNAAYKALGIDKQYSFEAKQIAPSALADFMKSVKTGSIYMLAVTIPHKETIMQYLDEIDETAKEIGAVNTVINNNGVLTGYNTDCRGAINALKQHTTLAKKSVVVLGSGGTAKAVIHGLNKEKSEIIICSRNIKEAEKLAIKYKCIAFPWEGIGNVAMADIIINTTPIGREGETFPFIIENMQTSQNLPENRNRKQIVFDVNYNSKEVPLLKDAKQIGAITIDGLELLLQQGILQFELYTGLRAPENSMRSALTNSKTHETTI